MNVDSCKNSQSLIFDVLICLCIPLFFGHLHVSLLFFRPLLIDLVDNHLRRWMSTYCCHSCRFLLAADFRKGFWNATTRATNFNPESRGLCNRRLLCGCDCVLRVSDPELAFGPARTDLELGLCLRFVQLLVILAPVTLTALLSQFDDSKTCIGHHISVGLCISHFKLCVSFLGSPFLVDWTFSVRKDKAHVDALNSSCKRDMQT